MSQELLPPIHVPWWKRLFRKPLFWALMCTGLASPWYLGGNGMELLPFLLSLVGGWLCGFAFVNFTFGIKLTGLGVLLHVFVAVLSGLLLHWLIFDGNNPLKELPQQLRAMVLFLQMGAIPGVGWIWLGLLSRITSIATKPSKSKAEKITRVAPVWEEARPGSKVQFFALPMRMRTLTAAIVGICVIGGGLAFLLMISFDSFLLRFGSANLIIVAFGLVIGLPGYYLFRLILGRKTIRYAVSFGRDAMRIQTESTITAVPYTDLERHTWRCESDYARVEVLGAGHALSLLVGMARTPKTVLPQLPPLSQKILRTLTEAGLAKQPSRRPDVTIFSADRSVLHGQTDKARGRS